MNGTLTFNDIMRNRTVVVVVVLVVLVDDDDDDDDAFIWIICVHCTKCASRLMSTFLLKQTVTSFNRRLTFSLLRT